MPWVTEQQLRYRDLPGTGIRHSKSVTGTPVTVTCDLRHENDCHT